MPGRIGFAFALGHGHYTQFMNFQDAWRDEASMTPEWIGLSGAKPGARWANLKGVPRGVSYRQNELWHFKKQLERHSDWSALFIASENSGLLPLIRKYPTYLYTDLTPSLKVSLAPWYAHQLPKSPLVRAAKTLVHGRVYRSAKGVFTMSRWASRGIEGDYDVPASRIHVTLPGANLKSWHFVDRSQRSGEGVRLLMVGGQFRLKGGMLLLDWARRTKSKGWSLDIVTWPGELPSWIADRLGPIEPSSHTVVSLEPELPNVRVHFGLRSNNPELMSLFEQADVFVLPTQADGSSIASLEAMATGLPVIVGGVGGIPELIDHGKTGFLVTPGSEQALTVRLEELIADRALRLSVGKAARVSCERTYNVERQLADILAVMTRESGS